MLRLIIVASVLCAVLMISPTVHAAGDGESGAAAAESLFQEGRRLADAKRYSEACPKFAASQKLAPAIGTLLNLADCYEKNNQLASAWSRFHEAIALAQRLGRTNREQTARERADKLEPRLIKVSIHSRTSGIEVKLDGNTIDAAALGAAIPVDAGKHTVAATAKGKKPYTTTIEVSEKSKSPTVEIPLLEDESTPAAAAAVATSPTGTEPPKENKEPALTPPPKEEQKSNWSGRKTVSVILASVGVVGLGVGTYYGVKARNSWREAQTYCSADFECTDDGIDLTTTAKRFAMFSNIGFAAGGALVAGGVLLFITAPSPKKTAAGLSVQRVGVGPGSIVLGGSF